MKVTEVCKKVGVSKNTLYKHLKRKTLKAKRHPLSGHWMVSEIEVNKLLDEMRDVDE